LTWRRMAHSGTISRCLRLTPLMVLSLGPPAADRPARSQRQSSKGFVSFDMALDGSRWQYFTMSPSHPTHGPQPGTPADRAHNLPILPILCSVFPGSSTHRRREPPGIWTEPSIPNGLKNPQKNRSGAIARLAITPDTTSLMVPSLGVRPVPGE
jgi:hypothetical protein